MFRINKDLTLGDLFSGFDSSKLSIPAGTEVSLVEKYGENDFVVVFPDRKYRLYDGFAISMAHITGHCDTHGDYEVSAEDGACPSCLGIGADYSAGAYGPLPRER